MSLNLKMIEEDLNEIKEGEKIHKEAIVSYCKFWNENSSDFNESDQKFLARN